MVIDWHSHINDYPSPRNAPLNLIDSHLKRRTQAKAHNRRPGLSFPPYPARHGTLQCSRCKVTLTYSVPPKNPSSLIFSPYEFSDSAKVPSQETPTPSKMVLDNFQNSFSYECGTWLFSSHSHSHGSRFSSHRSALNLWCPYLSTLI